MKLPMIWYWERPDEEFKPNCVRYKIAYSDEKKCLVFKYDGKCSRDEVEVFRNQAIELCGSNPFLVTDRGGDELSMEWLKFVYKYCDAKGEELSYLIAELL